MAESFAAIVTGAMLITFVGTVFFMRAICRLSREPLENELGLARNDLLFAEAKIEALEMALEKIKEAA